jgi:hypothetical protein
MSTSSTGRFAGLRLPTLWSAILVLAGIAVLSPAWGADSSKCGARLFVLWGDGRHDDTAALNAWFRGDDVIWGQTGRSVGTQIAGGVFRLSSAIYIPSGRSRSIARFQFVWPSRKELVSGGTIVSGADPDQPPVATGLTKIGAGPNEGVPYPSKTPKPGAPDSHADCLVS